MQTTVDFVRSHVAPCRLLEIGCGNGEVAAQLQRAGYELTAIDEDEEAIKEAQRKGVKAIKASWPNYTPQNAEAILFTRSLHHIPNTDAAIAHAAKHAKVVLVEDFAYEVCAPELIEWFANESGGAAEESFAKRLASAKDRQAFWHQEHDHNLATAKEMEAAMRTHFPSVEVTYVPYLFRYLGDADQATIQRLQRGEMEFGTKPLGRRYVGRR